MVVYIVVDMDVDKVADMVVKIPNDYYWCDWRLVILKEMVIGVVNVDVDKTLCEMNENLLRWYCCFEKVKEVRIIREVKIAKEVKIVK